MVRSVLLRETSIKRRRLLLAGYLAAELRAQGITPVVVGGGAVEVYTFNDYTTHDLDIVVSNREAVAQLLDSLGFEKRSGYRHWISEELEIAVEIPDHHLAGSMDRLTEVQVGDYTAYVIGVEDIIIDRLNAYVHWKSQSDYEQALRILTVHYAEIDQAYLQDRAEKNQVDFALEELGTEYRKIELDGNTGGS